MTSYPKALLFDLDGTLVRTGGAGIRALQRAFLTLYNVQNPLEGVTLAGNTDPNIYREVVQYQFKGSISPTTDEENNFFDHYLRNLREEIQSSRDYRVLPGILEILRRVSNGNHSQVYAGLGTGNLEPGALIKLERGGLNPYFSFGGFGSDSSNRPELLRIAVQKAQEKHLVEFKPHHVYVIGDTPRDIQAGQAIGARTIGVATGGYSFDDLKSHKPDYLVKNLENVDAFFEFVNDGNKYMCSTLAPRKETRDMESTLLPPPSPPNKGGEKN